MNLVDAKLALANLDERKPEFFVREALWHGDRLAIYRAQDILKTLGDAPNVGPRALKEMLQDGR